MGSLREGKRVVKDRQRLLEMTPGGNSVVKDN